MTEINSRKLARKRRDRHTGRSQKAVRNGRIAGARFERLPATAFRIEDVRRLQQVPDD
jgi:hypothetical protein